MPVLNSTTPLHTVRPRPTIRLSLFHFLASQFAPLFHAPSCAWRFVGSRYTRSRPREDPRERPRRGTSPPGIVRRTAAANRGGHAAEEPATSGYFSWRLLLRCGDYVCPLICAETRQRGPLSVPSRRRVGLWVFGSRAGPVRPIIYHGVSRTFFVLPSAAARRRVFRRSIHRCAVRLEAELLAFCQRAHRFSPFFCLSVVDNYR